MPILGIISSSADVAVGSFESIATVSGTGSSDSITFSSIPGTYKHLQIRGIASITNTSNDFGTIGLRFNGDNNTNYTRHYFRGFLSDANYVQSGNVTSANYAQAGQAFLNATNSPNVLSANIIDILDYTDTNKRTTVRGFSGTDWNSQGCVELASGLWTNTAAITSITVFAQNGNFSTKSTFALYGIKGV